MKNKQTKQQAVAKTKKKEKAVVPKKVGQPVEQVAEPTSEREVLQMAVDRTLPERLKDLSPEEWELEKARLRKGATLVATDNRIGFGIEGGDDFDATHNEVKAMEAFGVSDSKTMHYLMSMTGAASPNAKTKDESVAELSGALGVLAELAPANAHEGLIAMELLAVHAAGMKFLYKAVNDSTVEGTALHGNLAIKLLRTATGLSDALARLKGTEKSVVVKHVSVADGGQAVVGDIHHHSNENPHGKK